MSINNRHRFDGRVAVVTGAGAGLGLLYATEFARLGAKVVINDVGKDASGIFLAEKVVADLRKGGADVVADTGSVSDEKSVDAMVSRAVNSFGAVDILVNNAGNTVRKAVWELTTDDMRSVLDVHLFGSFWSMRAALPHMRRNGYGRIINTSSALGAFGAPQSAAYVTAKAGIIGLTRSAALDNADTDIKVNAIAPIAFTGMSKDFIAQHPTVDVTKLTSEMVAPAVLFLAHESCMLNGELLSVAAGRIARIAMITAPGYFTDQPTSEAIADNLDTIMDSAGFIVPGNSMDQYQFLRHR